MTIDIRFAAPGDAPAISRVHCSGIHRWVRRGADGAALPARYADLTPFERWGHGGPWLDPETCRHHLARLISGGGFPLAAEINGQVVGTAELNPADEPPPYGRNLNLSTLYVHRNHQGQGIGSALVQYALDLARREGCEAFLVANAEAPGFYRRHGLKRLERWTRFELPTAPARAAFSAEPLPDTDYGLVRGHALLIGRYQNAHHDWERTRPGAGPDFPEWRNLRLERRWLTTGRRARAAVIFEESPGRPGVAETFLFSPNPHLSPGLFTAVRGLAHTLGFTHLHCLVRADVQLPDAKATDYKQQLYAKRLT